ncbi:hypothetical protein ABZ434_26180 [Streptomyces sp. NPDC005761]|uniref:hypothetical protein n=1 Tax=unclassified Streptomyces TaxID=2593676 RepID=UPI0033DD841F
MQPVLEISSADDFALRPVGEHESHAHGPCPADPAVTFRSPVIELSADPVRRLIAGAQQDVRDFLSLAGTWAERDLPVPAAATTAALARALDLARTG